LDYIRLERERSILGDDAFARRRRDINEAMGIRARGPLNTADLDADSVWGGLQSSRTLSHRARSSSTPDRDIWEWIDVDKCVNLELCRRFHRQGKRVRG
jgi:hypothetical protein